MPAWIGTYLTDSNPYFYPAVFAALFLAGSGSPISADLVLLTVGYLAFKGQAEYWVLIPLCISAILISDIGMFFVGKHVGTRLLGIWPFRKVITVERMAKAETGFRKHGYRIVFLARFMPGVRTVFMFTSGVLGLRFWKFILHDLAGALIVVPSVLYSVKWAAGNKDVILAALHKGQWAVLAEAALFAVYFFFFRNRTKASSETRSNPASP